MGLIIGGVSEALSVSLKRCVAAVEVMSFRKDLAIVNSEVIGLLGLLGDGVGACHVLRTWRAFMPVPSYCMLDACPSRGRYHEAPQ